MKREIGDYKLIHSYFGVRLERVWRTANEEIPSLKPLFEKVLKDFDPSFEEA